MFVSKFPIDVVETMFNHTTPSQHVTYRNVILCENLHTMTSCKSKNCIEARLFTVNKSNSPSHKTNQFTRTWFRMSKLRNKKDLQVKTSRAGTAIRLNIAKLGVKYGVIC